MGGVGHEVTLGLERGFQAPEEVIEGLPQFGELVVWPVQRKAAVKVGGGDLARGSVHGAERAEEPAGDPPGQSQGDRPGDHGHDRRSDIEMVAEEGVV